MFKIKQLVIAIRIANSDIFHKGQEELRQKMFDDYEIRDQQEQENHRKRYLKKLHAHPSCQDPDHPGCPICDDEEDKNE